MIRLFFQSMLLITAVNLAVYTWTQPGSNIWQAFVGGMALGMYTLLQPKTVTVTKEDF